MSDLHYNPFDPELRRDPYPTYARLRAEAPVFEAPGLGLFVVSRHRDVTAVLRDAGSYSSSAFGELFSRVNTTTDRAEAVRGEQIEPTAEEIGVGLLLSVVADWVLGDRGAALAIGRVRDHEQRRRHDLF